MERLLEKLRAIRDGDIDNRYDEYFDAIMSARIPEFDKGWLRCEMGHLAHSLSADSNDFGDSLIQTARDIL